MLGERSWLADHDLASMSTAIGEWPLRFQPGQHWLYSHGMDVAARLVEIMSGQRFDEYLRTSIFDPLGMVDTGFLVPEDEGRPVRRELRPQRPQGTGPGRRPGDQCVPATSRSCSTAAAASSGTTADYVRFCAMLANGGELDGERVLVAARPSS